MHRDGCKGDIHTTYLVFISCLFFSLFLVDRPFYITEASLDKNYPTNEQVTYREGEYTIDSLFIALLSNGDASVDYNLIIESTKPTTNVTLFGQTVQNLTLMDYNGTNIQYMTTERPDKIRLHTQPQSNIHVTYTTPDLVDKQNRNWTFSFFFDNKFLLKIPTEARIIEMQPQPFLTPTYEQNLWGFGPGDVQVKYVIGPLGTKEEALASIRLIDEAVQQSKTNYKGIVINNITNLMELTKSSLNQGKYLETINYATKAYDLLQNTSEGYVLAQDTISQAEIELQKEKSTGYETSNAEELLIKAKSLFTEGQYSNASSTAKAATSQIIAQHKTFGPVTNIVITISILLGISVAIFFVIKKKVHLFMSTNGKKGLLGQGHEQEQNTTNNANVINTEESRDQTLHKSSLPNPDKSKNMSSMPVNIIPDSSPDEAEIRDYLNQVVEEVNNVRTHSFDENVEGSAVFSSTPSVDRDLLARQVAQMKMKKPYLRPEDKELLDFLVERLGSAFESEVRSKFVLPRTSLWRLVKRLEREELLEVRKIGGQNLIKLRLEKISD